MSGRVERTRWGDVVYTVRDDRGGHVYVKFPPEHPQVVCDEAVTMAGNQLDCLEHKDRYRLLSRCIDLDHLPRDKRVRELAVELVAMAVYDGWEENLYSPSEDGIEETKEAQAERAVLRIEGAQLAAEWKKTERIERRKRSGDK